MKPIEYQLITDFRGTKQDTSILTLRDVWSNEGSQCVWMDKLGRVRKLPGIASNAVTATAYQVDASACYPRSLAALYHPGTSDWFLLALFRKDASTKDIAYGELATATSMTKSDDADNALHMDSAELDQVLYLAFGNEGGNEAPKTATTNGTTVTVTDAGGTQSPTPSVAAGSGTGLKGTYEWKIVSIQTDGSRYPGSAASTEAQLDSTDADLTWTADTTNASVVGYEIYRTTGTGKTFRYAGYKDGLGSGTVAYTDALTDDELLNNRYLESHGEAPPTGAFWVEQWRQRIWWGRTTTYPTRIWWSDPGDGDSCDLSRNYLDLSEVDTSATEITGLRVLGDSLYVSTRSSIWRVSGSGEIVAGVPDWLFRRTSARAGWTTTFAVSTVPSGAVLTTPGGDVSADRDALVFQSGVGDIRAFDGDNDYVISAPIQSYDVITDNVCANLSVHSLIDDRRGHVYFFFPVNQYYTILIYNYRYGVWSRTPVYDDGWLFGSSVSIPDDIAGVGYAPWMLVGTGQTADTGKVYDFLLDIGVDLNGSGVDARFWTKPIFGTDENGAPLLHLLKRWRSIEPVLDATVNPTVSTVIDFHWYNGFAVQGATEFGKVLVAKVDGSTSFVSHSKKFRRLQNSSGDYLHSETIRFQVEEAGASTDWALDGFMIGYQVSDRVRDR